MGAVEGEPAGWRRRLPALVLIAVLAAAAAVVWTRVLHTERTITSRVGCPPAPAADRFTPRPYGALHGVEPAAPEDIRVQVRNATSRRDLAARVTARLELFGFTEVAEPDNDPFYPTGTLHCVGQIRYGGKGTRAARTISMLAPCAQLVRDDRAGDVVHLALGTGFIELSPNRPAREVLRTLRGKGARPAGGLQSVPGGATSVPPSTLARAHSGPC